MMSLQLRGVVDAVQVVAAVVVLLSCGDDGEGLSRAAVTGIVWVFFFLAGWFMRLWLVMDEG